jgi:hypothetical protein
MGHSGEAAACEAEAAACGFAHGNSGALELHVLLARLLRNASGDDDGEVGGGISAVEASVFDGVKSASQLH